MFFKQVQEIDRTCQDPYTNVYESQLLIGIFELEWKQLFVKYTQFFSKPNGR